MLKLLGINLPVFGVLALGAHHGVPLHAHLSEDRIGRYRRRFHRCVADRALGAARPGLALERGYPRLQFSKALWQRHKPFPHRDCLKEFGDV